jgi:signal transduction histidine kinase
MCPSLAWLRAAAPAGLVAGIGLRGALASRLFDAWDPGTFGMALTTAVGLATWIAAKHGRPEEDDDPSRLSQEDLIRNQIDLRDRLGRGLVEASERRQQHLRQSLEVGLVRQLSGISILAGLLQQRLAAQDRPEAAEIAKLKDSVERTIWEARLLAAAVHPPEIETDGLEAALQKMAGNVEKYHVYCRVVHDSCCPPPDAASALQFYRIVQILIERAVRHGIAHHILVELTAGPEKYMTMTVTDRVGYGDRLPELGASELCDLQARARSIGATLQSEDAAGAMRLTCRMVAKGPKLQA